MPVCVYMCVVCMCVCVCRCMFVSVADVHMCVRIYVCMLPHILPFDKKKKKNRKRLFRHADAHIFIPHTPGHTKPKATTLNALERLVWRTVEELEGLV